MKEGEKITHIEGSNGKYWVTNFGRIFRAPCPKRPNWNELNGEENHGYMRVKLSLDSGVQRERIHRLVAKAFLDNPDNKPVVNHIDGDKQNNKAENLEWCTYSENEYHSYRTLGKRHPKQLPENTRKIVRNLRQSGKTIREIAAHLGISESSVKKYSAYSRY